MKDSSTPPTQNLDHTKFLNNPGITFTAKKQCEILLRDHDAVVSPNQKLDTICYSLQCKTPHRSGFYYAGPALEGTNCGNGKVQKFINSIVKRNTKPFLTHSVLLWRRLC